MTTLRLPEELLDDEAAGTVLRKYFSPNYTVAKKEKDLRGLDGSKFETWDAATPSPTDAFTPADVLSLGFLSVHMPARAVYGLLVADPASFNTLLADVPTDLDLVAAGDDMIDAGSAASRLYERVRDLPGVGPTQASKLLHRKRPRLIPIRDQVISERLRLGTDFWAPLRQLLQQDDKALHQRLLRLRDNAGISDHISALRVLDVMLWMTPTVTT